MKKNRTLLICEAIHKIDRAKCMPETKAILWSIAFESVERQVQRLMNIGQVIQAAILADTWNTVRPLEWPLVISMT